MAEWIYEAGIGEARAALIEDDHIVEAHCERASDGPRIGAVMMARLAEYGGPGKGASVILDAPGSPSALLTDLPGKTAIGARMMVELYRMAAMERGRVKLARVRLAPPSCVTGDGPDLHARIANSGLPITRMTSHGPDHLEAAGWSEMLDQANGGTVPFPGGMLLLDLTPAMTMIDIDGDGDPYDLACAGARAAVAAIRRFGIGGNIGVDFPTLGGREQRLAIGALVDDMLPQPFERTAVNGFGLMQIIRRRARPSVMEQMQFRPVESAALALLRRAERAVGNGPLTLTAAPSVIAMMEANMEWTQMLQSRTGRPVRLVVDAQMKGPGHAQ